MGKLLATIKFTKEYGHAGNRPSEDFARKELTAAIEKAVQEARDKQFNKPFATDTELANWSFIGIEVE